MQRDKAVFLSKLFSGRFRRLWRWRPEVVVVCCGVAMAVVCLAVVPIGAEVVSSSSIVEPDPIPGCDEDDFSPWAITGTSYIQDKYKITKERECTPEGATEPEVQTATITGQVGPSCEGGTGTQIVSISEVAPPLTVEIQYEYTCYFSKSQNIQPPSDPPAGCGPWGDWVDHEHGYDDEQVPIAVGGTLRKYCRRDETAQNFHEQDVIMFATPVCDPVEQLALTEYIVNNQANPPSVTAKFSQLCREESRVGV